MSALLKVNKPYKLLFVFLILFMNIKCKIESTSHRIIHFYNTELNDNILNMVGQGRINYQLKYLLDTILNENFNKSDTDVKYCIFYFYEFSKTGSAVFIDGNDSVWYLLTEIARPDKRVNTSHGIYKVGDDIRHIYYIIDKRKIMPHEFNSICSYKAFFKNKPCNFEELTSTEGQPTNEIVLKFWNKINGKLAIEFYEFYDKNLIKEANRKKTKSILIKAGFDSSKIIQKKIKFIK